MRQIFVLLAGVMCVLGWVSPGVAQEKPAAETFTVKVREAGLPEAKAQEIRETFLKLMERRRFDIGDTYGRSKAFTFSIISPDATRVVYREGRVYRVFQHLKHEGAMVLMAGPGGVILIGEEGGRGVLQLVRDIGFSAIIGPGESGDGMICEIQPEVNPKRQGLFDIRFTPILRAHAQVYNELSVGMEGDTMRVLSAGKNTAMELVYDVAKDRLEQVVILQPGRGSILEVSRFMELPAGLFTDPWTTVAPGTRIHEVDFIMREGPTKLQDAMASYARVMEPSHARLFKLAVSAFRVHAQVMMPDQTRRHMTYSGLIDIREITFNLLNPKVLQSADGLRKEMDETIESCRHAQMTGSLAKSEVRLRLGQVLSLPLMGKTPLLVLRRQLLLADCFMTPAETGMTPESLTPLDGLVAGFLEGSPRYAPQTGMQAYVETSDAPAWAKLLSRIHDKTLGKMPQQERWGLVEAGLEELSTEGENYLSTARVLSNVLKDPDVREGVEKGIQHRLEGKLTQATEKVLMMLIVEDADPANLRWMNDLIVSTSQGLKSHALTPLSVPLLKAIREQRGTRMCLVAAKLFEQRPDPEGKGEADANGRKAFKDELLDPKKFTIASTIEEVSSPESPIRIEASVVAMVESQSLPWKWRRELCRRMGLTLEQLPKAAEEEVSGLFGCLDAMDFMPDVFWANARPGVKAYLLKAQKPEWARASKVLFTDENAQGLITLTGAKHRAGAARLLHDEALVKEHLGELRGYVESVKVIEPVKWLEEPSAKAGGDEK